MQNETLAERTSLTENTKVGKVLLKPLQKVDTSM